jgi:hypothetical protein
MAVPSRRLFKGFTLLLLFVLIIVENGRRSYGGIRRTLSVLKDDSPPNDGMPPKKHVGHSVLLSPLGPPRRLTVEQVRYLDETFRSKSNHSTILNHVGNRDIPYYFYGKHRYQHYVRHSDEYLERRKTVYLIENEEAVFLTDGILEDPNVMYHLDPEKPAQYKYGEQRQQLPSRTWVLPHKLKHSTRNHDTILLERSSDDRVEQIAVNVLGRHCRHVQWIDLVTGEQGAVRTRNQTDPAGMPLDDLNHVSAVLVHALDNNNKSFTTKQEIWLPCGFHNDRVNSEISTSYARIVEVETMRVRVGPKLPIAGGACVATAVTILPKEPPMICSFGGTNGTHDRGKFLPNTYCYDRIREKWWTPFGRLPYGLDHGSLAVIPAAVCGPSDPERILILNFRTRPYGDAHPEILAHDLPREGWTVEQLEASWDEPGGWYWYHNDTRRTWSHTKDVARDASGTIVVNWGRQVINFGGTYHYVDVATGRRTRGRFSMIRALDVCTREWSVVGDLGLETFALQTAASERLQLAVTCGGTAPGNPNNGQWCFVNRFDNNVTLHNRYPDAQ